LARRRLKVFEETSDGFQIAQADLAIRGPGELLGTRQAGAWEARRLTDLLARPEWIEKARRDAESLLEGEWAEEAAPLVGKIEPLAIERYRLLGGG
jgi:ATP-dependent DNA helicase RecG